MEPHSDCKKTGEEAVQGEIAREWRPREASDTVFSQQVKGSESRKKGATTKGRGVGGQGFAAE